MTHFLPYLHLADIALAGATDTVQAGGFKIQGGAPGDYSGFNMSPAGDVNGDGFDDIIICADGYDGGGDRAGAAYVLFGKATGFGPLDLGQLTAADGFVIQGESPYDLAGRSVASADVNGDGFTDLILAAFLRDEGGANSGGAYVVFGKADGFGTKVDTALLDGTNGFEIQGENAGDYAGLWVSGGDINGDGFDDVVVGAPRNGTSVEKAGAAYVIFGKADGFDALIDLDNLDGASGFKIQGEDARGYAGISVSLTGDVNGDGFDDVIVGAFDNDGGGSAFVVFGKDSGFNALVDLSNLAAADGFKIRGEATDDWAGFSVASAGDLNGDGIADILVGAAHNDSGGTDAGATYVIFGKTSGFASTVDLASLNGSNGFKIQGDTPYNEAGICVASAGDVNGDGFDDILVGARGDSGTVGTQAGAVYVIFGRASGFGAMLDLSNLSPSNGFKIQGEVALDYAGQAVSAAGDLNDDGFDDILVGSPNHSSSGHLAGATYVIFGRPDNAAPSGTDATISIYQNTTRVLAAADFGFTDGDGDALAGVKITSLPVNGRLYYDTDGAGGSAATVVGVGQLVSVADIVAGKLTFVPGLNASGSGYASFSFQVQDDGGVVASGVDLDQSANAITFDIININDSLRGTAGADILAGGIGNDSYIVNHAGDRPIELIGQGRDTAYATLSYALGAGAEVEILTVYDRTTTNALNLYGNEFANTLFGNNGANFLNGGNGADTLYGLGGDDAYFVDHASDTVVEQIGQGMDTAYTTVSHALAARSEVETLTVYDRTTTNALNLNGNEFANTIVGNNGANFLNGGGGGDTLYGLGGNDAYLVDHANDVVTELAGQGQDTVYTTVTHALAAEAEVETLTVYDRTTSNALDLYGNEFANRLCGNNGANMLNGRGGADTLYGLGGSDGFVFDTVPGTNSVDMIADFVSGVDKIMLDNAVFTGLAAGAIGSGAFTMGTTATAADHRIVYDQGSGALYFDADGNGSGTAILFAQINAGSLLVASDFLVI